MPRHELTPEERARGPANRAAANQKRREDAEELAIERLADLVVPALDALADLVATPDDPGSRARAATQILDRVLGRATQRTEHSGRIDHTIVTAEAREYLARKLSDRATRAAEAADPGGAKR
jgi:hypothetical protein